MESAREHYVLFFGLGIECRSLLSLSLYHKDHPYSMTVHGQKYEVAYWPGDSKSGMFGGNSNW
jgi:hypothetical protein